MFSTAETQQLLQSLERLESVLQFLPDQARLKVEARLREAKRRKQWERIRYWIPSAPPFNDQRSCYLSLAKVIFAGGGNRSGKTELAVARSINYCTGQHPTLSLRRQPPVFGRYIGINWEDSIKKVILKKFETMTRRQDLYGGSWETAWNDASGELQFCMPGDTKTKGSKISFLTSMQRIAAHAGDDLDFVVMDEHHPKEYYTENIARLVDRNGWMLLTMTPEAGITWEDDEIILRSKEDSDYQVYYFDSRLNPHLSQEGLASLIKTIGGDSELFDAKIRGLFVVLSGRVYKMFNEQLHVIDDFDLPREGYRQCLLDPHLAKPHAVAWFYWSRIGNVYLYRAMECESSKEGIPELARKIRLSTGAEEIDDWIMDEAMGGDPEDDSKNNFGQESIITQLNNAGLPFLGTGQKSSAEFEAGLLKVRQFLIPNATSGVPRLRIFRSCWKAWRQMMIYQWKKKTKVDEETYRERIRNIDDEFPTLVRYAIEAEPPWNLPKRSYARRAADADIKYDPMSGEPQINYHDGGERRLPFDLE